MATANCGFDGRPDALVQYGPTILVQIGFDPEFGLSASRHPNLPANTFHALVDTGATESCIDSALAIELNLPVVDRRLVAGVHGANEVNVHLAQIHIPALPHTIVGMFAGVHLTAGGQPYSALIGRTFLRNFNMTYEGRTGAVVISND